MDYTTWRNLWQKLTVAHAANDDEARREYMSKALLLTLTIIVVFVLLLSAVGTLLGAVPLDTLAIVAVMLLVFGGGWRLAQQGYWRVSSFIPPVIIFLIAVYGNYIGGIGAPAMLLYALTIILAIMFLPNWTHWPTLIICLAAYLGLGWAHASGRIIQLRDDTAFTNRAVIVTGVLVAIAFLLWFLINQFQHALADMRAYAGEVATFKTLAENATDAISMMDGQSRLHYANLSFIHLFGYDDTPAEIMGLTLTDLTAAEEITRLQTWQSAQNMATAWSGEIKFRRRNETLFEGWLTLFPLQDKFGQPNGSAAIIRDLTERKQVEAERAQLLAEQTAIQQQIIGAQQQTLKELSTPIIPVMDQIIVVPLIGSTDNLRARDITRSLLAGITQHRAKIVILDVTGVSTIDTTIIQHLNKTIQAAQLKGAQTIVTGISDAIAETIVDLGIDWSGVTTLTSLQTGLVVALNSLGVRLTR